MNKKTVTEAEIAIKKELERLYHEGAFKNIEKLILEFGTKNKPGQITLQFSTQAYVPKDDSSVIEARAASIATGERDGKLLAVFGLF